MVSTRTRLIIDVRPELRRRIKLAAAAGDVSVREYVVSILEQVVPSEAAASGDPGRPITAETVRRLSETRAAVMRGRVFTDDSADLIREMREERSEAL